MKIKEIRQQYPEYRDLDDGQLADLLHKKFYPDMAQADFNKRIGFDTSGFIPAAKAGLERLKGEAGLLAGKTGLMSLKEAEEYRKTKEEEAKRIFTPTEKGWTEAPWTKFKETLGESVPYMAAPLAAGAAAAALPLTGTAATVAGLGAAGLASGAQFTGSNIARQMEEGKSLEQASLGKAALAAVPQAALDTLSMKMIPGIGRIFGAAGSKVTAETAESIAKQSLGKIAADYAASTGKAMTTEGLTEAAQQVFERMQAGLSITDPKARKEYFDSFLGGAILGGALAPAGRYVERASAPSEPRKPAPAPAEPPPAEVPAAVPPVFDDLQYAELTKLREQLREQEQTPEIKKQIKELSALIRKQDIEFTKQREAERAKAKEDEAKAAASAFAQPDQEVLQREGLDVEALQKGEQQAKEGAIPASELDQMGTIGPRMRTWLTENVVGKTPEELQTWLDDDSIPKTRNQRKLVTEIVENNKPEAPVEPEAAPAPAPENVQEQIDALSKRIEELAPTVYGKPKRNSKGFPEWQKANAEWSALNEERTQLQAAAKQQETQPKSAPAVETTEEGVGGARPTPTLAEAKETLPTEEQVKEAQDWWNDQMGEFVDLSPENQAVVAKLYNDGVLSGAVADELLNEDIEGRTYKYEPPALSRKERTGHGLQKNEVGSIVDAIRAKWNNAPDIAVVENMDDSEVPQFVRDYDKQQRAAGATGEPEAFWYKGKAYFVAGQLRSPTEVMRAMFHEILGHYGLRGTFGKALDPILNQIATARRAEVEAKAKEYGLDINKPADRLQAAEEVLVNLAQTKPEIGFVQRAVAAIRTWLRDNVPVLKSMSLTDDEIIRSFVLPARRFVEQGAKRTVAGEAAFSRAAQPAPSAAVNPSLMARAEGIEHKPLTPKDMVSSGVSIVKNGFTDPVGKMLAVRTMVADKWATVEQRLQNKVDSVRAEGSERAAAMTIARQAEDVAKLLPSLFYKGKVVVDKATRMLKIEDGATAPAQMFEHIQALAAKYGVNYEQAYAYASTIMEGKRLQSLLERNKNLKESEKEVMIHWRKPDGKIDYAGIKQAAMEYDTHSEYKTIANIMDNTRKGLINELIASGWVDAETGAELRDVEYYVPFDRLNQDNLDSLGKAFREAKKKNVRGIAQISRMPELRGAFDRPVANVIGNYFKTLTWLTTELAKQNATSVVMADMEASGYAKYLGKTKAHAQTGYTVPVYKKGEAHFYELPTKYDYVAFLDRSAPKGWFVSSCAKVAGFLRTTITANPVFAMRQVAMDIQGALLLADVKNPVMFVRDVLGNFASLSWHELKNIPKGAKGDRIHHHKIEQFMADRGLSGEVDYTVSDPALDLMVSQGLRKRTVMGSAFLGAAVHGFKQITNASDLAVRKALYDDTMRATHDEMLAGTKARELINFRRRGAHSFARDMVAMVPFLNAHIQSMDILWREATGQGASITGLNRAQAKAKFIKAMGIYAGIATIYAMMRNGDDDYDKMDARVKNDNWLFSGEEGGIRIPIRGDLGVIKVGIENAVDWFKRQGTAEEREAKEAVATTMAYVWEKWGAPNLLPAALRPLAEIMTNHSFLTGRELEGTYQKTLMAHQRQTSATPEVLKGMAMWLNDTVGVDISPIMLDTALRGYFGVTGATVAGLTDMMLNPDAQDRPLHKMMAIGAFAWDKTQLTQEKNEFYDLLDPVMKAKKTFDDLKSRDVERARSFFEENKEALMLAPLLQRTVEDLGQMRKVSKYLNSPMAKEHFSPDEIADRLEMVREQELKLVGYVREMRARFKV